MLCKKNVSACFILTLLLTLFVASRNFSKLSVFANNRSSDQIWYGDYENGNISVGKPCLEDAKVEGTILGHIRSKKVTVYKMRPKKKTRKKQGHRDNLTRVLVDKITINGKTI